MILTLMWKIIWILFYYKRRWKSIDRQSYRQKIKHLIARVTKKHAEEGPVKFSRQLFHILLTFSKKWIKLSVNPNLIEKKPTRRKTEKALETSTDESVKRDQNDLKGQTKRTVYQNNQINNSKFNPNNLESQQLSA